MPFVVSEPSASSFGSGQPQSAEVSSPTFAWPFEIRRAGAHTVQQNGIEDIQGCVTRLLVCPELYRDDLPEFGVPDLEFNTVPLPVAEVGEALEFWEPRATLEIVEEALNEVPGERVVTVEVSD